MPMPPSQWLSWRQNSIDRARSSIRGTSVAPVAVKPDTASKYASTGRESCGPPSRMYGSAPKIGISSHSSATTRKLSRGVTEAPASSSVIWSRASPARPVIAPATTNDHQGSP